MGALAQQSQAFVLSTSWKSAANMPPVVLPEAKATCTANVSLRHQDMKASIVPVRISSYRVVSLHSVALD